jgi:hypothetical protein
MKKIENFPIRMKQTAHRLGYVPEAPKRIGAERTQPEGARP